MISMGKIESECAMALVTARKAVFQKLSRIAWHCVGVRSSLSVISSRPDRVHVEDALSKLEAEITDESDGWLPGSLFDGVFAEIKRSLDWAESTVIESLTTTDELSDVVRQSIDVAMQLRATLERASLLEERLRRLSEHKQSNVAVRERVWAATGGKCFYCSVEMVRESGFPHSFVVDHIVPKNAGGPDHVANFIPACAKCNGDKSDRPFVEFVADRRLTPVLRFVGGGAE